jgi:hypothetical protein
MTQENNEFCQALNEDEEIDLTDPLRPTGPYGMSQFYLKRIAEIEAAMPELPPAKRKRASNQIRFLKRQVKWCRSRAGYVEP